MAKLNEPTVAQVWGTSLDFAQRAQQAAPDSVMRDIVADGRRASPVNPWPATSAPARLAEKPVPTYVEWCRQRLGVEWPAARAKDYYLTLKTRGEDVGAAQDEPQVGVPRNGWVDPPKVADWRPPGLAVMDRMMDVQDALDGAERSRRFNRLPLNGGE